jgi:hypothetical protein
MPKTTGEGRSMGNVMEPGDGYLPNGKPNLSPDAGYVAAEPVQYADESDTRYQDRLALWNERKATAEQIAAGGATFEQRRDALEAKHEVEMNALEAEEARSKGEVPTSKKGKNK